MKNFDISVYAYDIITGRPADLTGHFEWVIQSFEVSLSADFKRSISNVKQIGLHPCSREEFETKFPDYDVSI